ncbi:hypothetical protein MIM_c07710 [Advenella mimigardefordensis DPN7]|uniref:SH3b domain-containing protein n=2 Tax=Advenella mimigardefordensis TaxID=302406 RepID=W0PBS7_ADVMD|nr:hypothetical protein MIM_c07710 [Advenella mimigardefordensis DPN7]
MSTPEDPDSLSKNNQLKKLSTVARIGAAIEKTKPISEMLRPMSVGIRPVSETLRETCAFSDALKSISTVSESFRKAAIMSDRLRVPSLFSEHIDPISKQFRIGLIAEQVALGQMSRSLRLGDVAKLMRSSHIERLGAMGSVTRSIGTQHINSLFEPYRKKQKEIQDILKPQLALQSRYRAVLEPLAQTSFQAAVGRILASELRNNRSIVDALERFNPRLSDEEMASVHLEDDGEFSVAGEVVTVEALDQALKQLEIQPSTDDQDFIDQFFKIFARLTKEVKTFLHLLLLTICANQLAPLLERWAEEFANTTPRVAVKAIKQEAKAFYEPGMVSNYRFVTVSLLNVRKSNSSRSEKIDTLSLGKTVTIVTKLKDWTLVEYLDDEGDMREGWVFSRYLHKLVK